MVLNLTGTKRYTPMHAGLGEPGLLSPGDYTLLHSMQPPLERLNYALAADQWSTTALAAATWHAAHTAQNFAVTSTASVLLFELQFGALFNATAAGVFVARIRVSYDSAAAVKSLAAAGGNNTLWETAQGATWTGSGFSAGTHTIRIEVNPNVNCNAFLRASSAPTGEFLSLRIWELCP